MEELASEKRDICMPLFWSGVVLLLACVFLGGVWGPFSAANLSKEIEEEVRVNLHSSGMNWVEAETKGQKVVLTGLAPSEEKKNAAHEIAISTMGRGGNLSGAVTKLDDQIEVLEQGDKHVWSAERLGKKITLRGYAPDTEFQSDLEDYVTSNMAYNVINNMELSAFSTHSSWKNFVELSLEQLRLLDPGKVEIVGNHLTVSGTAESYAAVDTIASTIATISDPFTAELKVLGPYEWGADLHGSDLTLSGYVPDDESYGAMLSIIDQHFEGEITDELGIGGERGWVRTALIALPQFLEFESGQLSYSDGVFYVRGSASESAFAFLNKDLEQISGDFGFQYDVDIITPELSEIEDLVLENDENSLDENCQTAFGRILATNRIYFDSGSTVISRQSGASLDKLAAVTRKCSTSRIQVEGHTDNVGSLSSNLNLSEQRAQSVVDYLVSRGIRASQIEARGFGPTKPAASNSTEFGRAQNRRIEFVIVNEESR